MGAAVQFNDLDVVACRLVLPRAGAGWGDFAVASADPLADGAAVTVAIEGGPTLQGVTVANRTRVFLDTLRCRVVLGKGGLGRTCTARFYQRIPARNVVSDILGAGGESLSSTASATVLSTLLTFWTVGAVSVGSTLSTIAAYLGASWRVLADGTIWIGVETWPTADPERVLLVDTPTEDRAEYAVIAPSMLPATTVDGRRISRVEHLVGEEQIRSIAWFE